MSDRYWNPAGAQNWNSANSWSLTNGGTPDQATPTSADNVYFTSTNVQNCTLTGAIDCGDLTFNGGTGYTGTFAVGNSQVNVYGSLTLYSGMTITSVYRFNFKAIATGKTVTFAGKESAITNSLYFQGVGGEWTLQDDYSVATKPINITDGSVITNGKTITCSTFSITGSSTRSVNINSSTINCTGWTATDTTGLTWSCTSSVIKVTGSGDFDGGGLTYAEVQLNGTAHSVKSSNSFTTLTRTSTNTTTDTMTFYADQTVTSVLNTIGYSSIKRPLIQSDVVGTQRTLTLTGATRNYSNCDFADIRFTSGSDGTVSIVGDCGGNTGITVDTPITVYWKRAASGNISDIAYWFTQTNGGGSNNQIPLPQHTLRFDNKSFNAGWTITPNLPRIGGMDWSGCTNSPTLGYGTITTGFKFYGSLTFGTMTVSAGSQYPMYASGRGSYTITYIAARNRPLYIDAYNGTYTLQDAVDTVSYLYLVRGTLVLNNNNIKFGAFSAAYTTARAMTFSGSETATQYGANGADWDLSTSTNMTFNKGTGTIKFENSSTNPSYFKGGDLTYYRLWNACSGAAGYLYITGTNIFYDIKTTVNRRLSFPNGIDTHTTTFTALGSAGNACKIYNTSSTTKFNLVKDGGGVISGVDYLDIQYCAASPANTWYVGTNSITNNANNTGLIFSTMIPLNLADTVNISDSLTKTIGKQLSNTVNLSDLLSKVLTPGGGGLTLNLSDTVHLSDNLTRNTGKRLADTVNISENLKRNTGKALANTVNFSDSLTRNTGKKLADTVNISESLAKNTGKRLSDNVSLSDSLTKSTGKGLSDTVNLSDNLNKIISLHLDNTVTFSENLIKSFNKKLSDTVTISDMITNVMNYSRTFSDTVYISDSLTKEALKALSDTVKLNDNLTTINSINLILSDTIYLSDAIIKTIGIHKADNVSFSDTLTNVTNYYRTFTDNVTFSDSLKKELHKTFNDNLIISDILTKGITKQLADTLTISDIINLNIIAMILFDNFLMVSE